MTFPERFSDLPEYAFPRLRRLLDAHPPGGEVVHMSIGEPKHAFPDWVGAIVAENADGFGRYPPNDGTPELLGAIADWYQRRYGQTLDPAIQIMALNGSREGLFNAALALCREDIRGQRPAILIPNPFYQVYAIGARQWVPSGQTPAKITSGSRWWPQYKKPSAGLRQSAKLCTHEGNVNGILSGTRPRSAF